MALVDYKSKPDAYPKYVYRVSAAEPIENKLEVYKEFLLTVKQDCSVSFSTKEPRQHLYEISTNAISTSGDEGSSILIGLSSDPEKNEAEYNALYQQWVDVLELSLKLEDKWNGTSYFVFKGISRVGKKTVLKRFIDKYQGSQFSINPDYGGGTTFKVTASTEQDRKVLLIDYMLLLPTEKEELNQAFIEYTSTVSE